MTPLQRKRAPSLGRSPTGAAGKRWRFDRTEYRLAADQFSIIGTRRAVVRQAQIATLSQSWGFDVKAFTGCVVARGRRL